MVKFGINLCEIRNNNLSIKCFIILSALLIELKAMLKLIPPERLWGGIHLIFSLLIKLVPLGPL